MRGRGKGRGKRLGQAGPGLGQARVGASVWDRSAAQVLEIAVAEWPWARPKVAFDFLKNVGAPMGGSATYKTKPKPAPSAKAKAKPKPKSKCKAKATMETGVGEVERRTL